MRVIYWARIKKMLLTRMNEEGGVSGAVLALFLLFVLIVAFVMVAVHFGYTWSSIVSGFKKFFGVIYAEAV